MTPQGDHPKRIGKYELEEFLGGGMSHVYRARDTVIGRTVAVKILTEAGCEDQEAKARFLAEARMAGNLSHDNILGIYAMLRSLAQRRVSPKVLGGPPAIAQMAYNSAASSWTDLIHFLGMLSINLAVLNFLPIPPLDGGQMMFLLAEGIRGKPLPDSAVIVGSWMGLLLVLALMVFVIFQDVVRMMTG